MVFGIITSEKYLDFHSSIFDFNRLATSEGILRILKFMEI